MWTLWKKIDTNFDEQTKYDLWKMMVVNEDDQNDKDLERKNTSSFCCSTTLATVFVWVSAKHLWSMFIKMISMTTMMMMQYRECQPCQDRRRARSSTLPARPCPNVQTYSMLGQVETHSINSIATNKNHYYHWRPENHLYHFRDLRAETSRPSFSSRESSFDSSASFRPISFTWHRMCAVVIILKVVMMISHIYCCCRGDTICGWIVIVR